MYLCDRLIRQESEKNKLIDPFNEKNLTPNGYDLSIKNINNLTSTDKWLIGPATDIIVLSVETVNMPHNYLGNLWLKTRWARKGVGLRPGVVDAGFRGQLNLCLTTPTTQGIEFHKGDKIVQITFSEVYPPEKLYEERSGTYQNQHKVIK